MIFALYAYLEHLNIEAVMQGICDSGEILIAILVYEDCTEAKRASNIWKTVAIGCGIFSLIFFWSMQTEANKREREDEAAKEEQSSDSSEALVRLGEMYEKGLLTTEEFTEQKRKLLK